MSGPYAVAVVVDPRFGNRLPEIASNMPLWVADTPDNHPAAEAIRAAHRDQPSVADVTTFKVDSALSCEQWFVGILENVELHHGEYSHDPPVTALFVYGAALIPSVRSALAEFGYKELVEMPGGFTARKNSRA